jgi:hypothetical protein
MHRPMKHFFADDSLEHAYQDSTGSISGLKVDPMLDPLRSEVQRACRESFSGTKIEHLIAVNAKKFFAKLKLYGH